MGTVPFIPCDFGESHTGGWLAYNMCLSVFVCKEVGGGGVKVLVSDAYIFDIIKFKSFTECTITFTILSEILKYCYKCSYS